MCEEMNTAGEPSILVVDDEERIGKLFERILGAAAEVRTATTADEALEVAQQRGFDVILSDLQMPGMSGSEMYQRIAEDHAGLAGRMVFMTGGVITDDAEQFIASVDNPVVHKPVDFSRLAELLGEVMDRPFEL